jgi:hypothetical protein
VYMKTYGEKKEPAFGDLKLSAQTFSTDIHTGRKMRDRDPNDG